MKLNTTDKLYKQLSPTQAAAMAFEAAVRKDADELALIVRSQPLLEYRTPSVDYMHRSIGLCQMSLFYGVIYWKETARLIRAGHHYNDDIANQAGATLGSMDAALTQVCDNLKVDIAAVKQQAMIPGDGGDYQEFADAALTAEFIEILIRLAQ